MATIPVYGQQRVIGGVQSAPTASSNVRADNPVFTGVQNLGNAMGNLGGVLAAEARKKEEDRAAVEVANALSQGEVYWQQNIKERTNAWKVGDDDMRGGFGTDFDKWVSENTEKLPTDAAKKYFQQHTAAMKGRYQQGLFTFQDKTTTDKLNADTEVGIQDDENIVFNDASLRADVLARRAETILARNDLNEGQKLKLFDTYRRKLDLAAERGEMERDPAGWYVSRFGGLPESVGGKVKAGDVPAAGFDGVMESILKREGGYTAQDGNSGAPANFGINQKYNPDIDVKNLTRDGAKAIYKERYWNAIKGDSLPPELQGSAMDAAVNQGVGNANKWIKESGGDVVKFNALRRAHYEKLLAKPEYERFRNTWMERLTAYEAQAKAPRQASAGGDVPAPASLPRSYSGLDWEQQSAMKRQAEVLIKQDQTKAFANASIETAQAAVSAQRIGTTDGVDLQAATATAIGQLEARLGKRLDATEAQAVEAQVARAASVRERDRKIAQDNAAGSMFDLLDQNGGDYQDLQRKMAGQMDTLPRATLDRLQKYAGEVATGGTRVTDWQAYSQLIENPGMLASVNLSALRDKFSRDEFAQLQKLQQATLTQQQNNQPDTIQSDMAVVKGLLESAGIKDKGKQAKFFSVLQTEMEAAMREKGPNVKKLSQTEIDQLATKLLTKQVISKGWLWDTKDYAYVNTIPRDERKKLEAALNAAGMPVNEANMQRWYRAKQARQPVANPVASTPAFNGYGQDTGIQPIQR